MFHQKRIYYYAAGVLGLVPGVDHKTHLGYDQCGCRNIELSNGETVKTIPISKRRRVTQITAGFPSDLGIKKNENMQ